ncbi:MAG: methyltransferase [Candidatus Eisenbacteria bacterium]|nr:methyltransferase [Candidatus Eisenbacteria bacterium]
MHLTVAERSAETEYEKKLKSKALVRWLHSFRYKHLRSIVAELAADASDRPLRIVEVGCAHGALFDALDPLFDIDYTGIDPTPEFARAARERHEGSSNFRVIADGAENVLGGLKRPDLVVALETLEHVPTRAAVRIVEAVADLGPDLFVCSVPVEVGPIIWIKNLGSLLIRYNRSGRFNRDVLRRTFWAGLYQMNRVPVHRHGHTGFDWRWVGQTIRHEMRIREIRTLPFRFLPAGLSTNVMFLAEPRRDGRGGTGG